MARDVDCRNGLWAMTRSGQNAEWRNAERWGLNAEKKSKRKRSDKVRRDATNGKDFGISAIAVHWFKCVADGSLGEGYRLAYVRNQRFHTPKLKGR